MQAGVWDGPSGESFARVVRRRLGNVDGLRVEVTRSNTDDSAPGCYLVDIEWTGGLGLLCEVVDAADTVRVIDPNGEDVPVDVALRYIRARTTGLPPKQAWKSVCRH